MIIQIVADAPISDLDRLDRNLPVICLDGAIYRLLDSKIRVKYLVGDLDAVDEAILARSRSLGVSIMKVEDQDSNDLEKGVMLAIELGATEIIVFQAIGGRMDQTLHNVGLLKKFYAYAPKLSILNNNETILYLENGSFSLQGRVGLEVAIMSFPRAVVTSRGLEYDMQELELKLGAMQSSSNKLNAEVADITIDGAALLIHHKDITLHI